MKVTYDVPFWCSNINCGTRWHGADCEIVDVSLDLISPDLWDGAEPTRVNLVFSIKCPECGWTDDKTFEVITR